MSTERQDISTLDETIQSSLDSQHSLDKTLAIDVYRLAAYKVVGIGVLSALVLFALLEQIEQLLMPHLNGVAPQLAPLIRGFIATACAMSAVWWLMHRQETALIRLKNQAHQQLNLAKQELRKTTDELRREHKRKEKAVQEQREDFIAALKRHLKNPLIASHRALCMLLDGSLGEPSDKQAEVLTLIAHNNQELSQLIDILVDMYGHPPGLLSLNLRTNDLLSLLNEVAAKAAETAKSKGVKLSTYVSPERASFTCDRNSCAKLLEQLVEIALQHAKSEVHIYGYRDELLSAVSLVVTADGPGIPEADVPDLFDHFPEASGSDKLSALTKTALFLCGQMARALGATITYDPAPADGAGPGAGCRFLVHLPLKMQRHESNAGSST